MAWGNEAANRELNEYINLCAALEELYKKFLQRKQELCRILEETAALKREALVFLAKANRLTRHLTGRQRQMAGFTYCIGDIRARLLQVNKSSPVLFGESSGEVQTVPALRKDCLNRAELRQKGLLIIGMIDRAKKNLLQLDLLELRCRELVLSIKKAMEAFGHEYRIIRRKIYPFGILSQFLRSLRFLWGAAYFSREDMEDVGALGALTGMVLKLADSELL